MGNGVRRGSPEDLRNQAREQAYINDQALKRELQELLLLESPIWWTLMESIWPLSSRQVAIRSLLIEFRFVPCTGYRRDYNKFNQGSSIVSQCQDSWRLKGKTKI